MAFENPFRMQNDRLLLEALAGMRAGWVVLRDAVLPSDGPSPELRVEYVLAHPDVGIAVLEILPAGPVLGAAQRIRRQFEAGGKASAQRGAPPVAQVRLHHTELDELEAALDEAFSRQDPAVPARCGETWLPALKGMLRATSMQAASETKPMDVPRVPLRAVADLPEDNPRHISKHNPRIKVLAASWSGAFVVAAGIAAVLPGGGPAPERPASPLAAPPAVAAEPAPPEPRGAPISADVRAGAAEAAGHRNAPSFPLIAPAAPAPSGAPAAPAPSGATAATSIAKAEASAAPRPRQSLPMPSAVGMPGPPETPALRAAAVPLADAVDSASPSGGDPAGQMPAPSAPEPSAPASTAGAPPTTAPPADLALTRAEPASEAGEPAAAARTAPQAAPIPGQAEDPSPPAAVAATPGAASTAVAADPPGARQGPAGRRDAVPDGEPPQARNANPVRADAGAPVARPAAPEPQSEAAAPEADETERQAKATPSMPPALVEALVSRGDAMVARRDISAARLLYERAAAAGDARAASALARTYDPAFLAEVGARGVHGDAALAAAWYRKAVSLGDGSRLARVEALNGPDRSEHSQGRR
jgi:hypothetical protein